MATASISTKGRAVRDRFRQNRQKGKHDDLEKDDEASRQKIHPRQSSWILKWSVKTRWTGQQLFI